MLRGGYCELSIGLHCSAGQRNVRRWWAPPRLFTISSKRDARGLGLHRPGQPRPAQPSSTASGGDGTGCGGRGRVRRGRARTSRPRPSAKRHHTTATQRPHRLAPPRAGRLRYLFRMLRPQGCATPRYAAPGRAGRWAFYRGACRWLAFTMIPFGAARNTAADSDKAT